MTKYQTFNNNKVTNLSLSSPNKKKAMNSDDDEMWTYLKTNSETSSGKNNLFSSDNTNRLSMGTLKENLKHIRTNNDQQNTDNKRQTRTQPNNI